MNIFYGVNSKTDEVIVYNRSASVCGAYFGSIGTGKRFYLKQEIALQYSDEKNVIYIIDMNGEYSALAKTYHGIEYLINDNPDVVNTAIKTLQQLSAEKDKTSRLVVFNLKKVSENKLQTILVSILTCIWGFVMNNASKCRYSFIYIDDILPLLRHKKVMDMVVKISKRARPQGCILTYLNNEFADMVKSEYGRALLINTDFILSLKQSEESVQLLIKEFGEAVSRISDYITNSEVKSGIILTNENKEFVPIFLHMLPMNLECLELELINHLTNLKEQSQSTLRHAVVDIMDYLDEKYPINNQ